MQGLLMAEDGYIFTDTDIYFQLSRSRNLFEISYQVNQDYSEGYILMTREGHWIYDIEKRLEETTDLKKLNWNKRAKLMKAEILKDENCFRKLTFVLNEIK
jgi:hypothetical protein